MAEKKVFHRSRTFYIISAMLFLLAVTGYFFWRNFKYRLVNKKVDQLVSVKSKDLYQVRYKNLVIDEVLGNISVENVELIPDSLIYLSLREKKNDPGLLLHIRIPSLLVTGVKTPKALLHQEISAHLVKIENAVIEVSVRKEAGGNHPDIRKSLSPDLYRQLLGKLKSIHADSIILENAALVVTDMDSKDIRCKAAGVSLRFAGAAIDSLPQNDSSRILFSKDLALHVRQIELPLKHSISNFQVFGLDFNSQTATLHTDHIILKPLLSESAFARAHKYAQDRFDFLIGSLDLKHIDKPALIRQQLIADTMRIASAAFRIYRDKSRPHDSVDRTHSYPQEAIMLLPLKILLKKIVVTDSYIEYKEKNDKSDSSGKVSFYQVYSIISNVTNIPGFIRKNNQMRVQFNAAFLNKAKFNANIVLKLGDPNGNFQMTAGLGPLDAVALNPLLKPMALSELDKGKINGLHYHLSATNTHGKGTLMLTYENISVKLLKKDNGKNKYKTKLLPTIAAGFVLKNSNPQDGKTRLGIVNYNRDKYRSIFNMMWKSLLTGIKQVAL